MRVLQVLPRNMTFSRRGATSIDLFVAEMVSASRFAGATLIAAEAGLDPPLLSGIAPLDPAQRGRARTRRLVEIVAAFRPDVVVVQQHAPTAVRLARRIQPPVVLQRHNFLSAPNKGALAGLKRYVKRRGYQALAGVTFVSEASLAAFQRDWPELSVPTAVIPNGAAFGGGAAGERTPEILLVGRAAPEKGILPAVRAIAAVLARHPAWSATVLLSEGGAHPAYARAVRAAAEAAGDRLSLRYDVPHDVVLAYNARAAIAVVPSLWQEPFGRTALEAHAGGAAVISSGAGGLREVSGEAAIYLNAVTPEAIAAALDLLIGDPAARQALAARGFARAQALFDLAKIAARLDDFLARVAAGAVGRDASPG